MRAVCVIGVRTSAEAAVAAAVQGAFLVDARAAYQQASVGPAAQLTPADLHTAKTSLDATGHKDEPSVAANVPADNTKKNERDQEPAAVTPGDQAENEADRTITQHVRQEVVGKDSLSMDAKNVKIITANGVVTLRGPVKTPTEKSEIARIAQSTAGVTGVDNQLEVAAN